MMKDIKKIEKNDDEIDVGAMIHAIRYKWHYFAASLVISLLAAFFYIKFSLPLYQAKGSVLIKDTKSASKDITDFIAGEFLGDQTSVSTEMGILGSQSVIKKSIKDLNLEVSYFDNSGFPKKPVYKSSPINVVIDSINPALVDQLFSVTFKTKSTFILKVSCNSDLLSDFSYEKIHSFNEKITTPAFTLSIRQNSTALSENKYTGIEFVVNSINKLTSEIQENLKINPTDRDANIISLTYSDNDADRAVDIINTICKTYIQMDVEDKTSVASLTLKFVDEQLAGTSSVLSGIENQLQAFKEKNKTVNLSEEAKNILTKLNDIDAEKIKTEIEIKSLDNLSSYVETNKELSLLAPSSLGIPDPLLIELIENYQVLQSKRKSISQGTTEITPALKIIDSQIAGTRASLLENIKSIRSNVSVSAQALKQELAELESKIKAVPEIERELLNIQRQFDVNQNIYLFLLQKKAEASIAKATAVSDNKVLDEASLEADPVAPNKKLIFFIALIFAFVIPSLIILFQNLFKQTISGKNDIIRLTDIPIIGAVGHMKKADNLIVTNMPKSIIAEAFRSVRTNLKFFGTQQNNKIILITSSVGSEGKSFATINLASVFAMQGHKVVIIGLDLRKPKLFQDLNISNITGMSSYLIGLATEIEILNKTSIENLFLISSGPVPPNPAELITKKHLADLLESLSKKFDYIFIDTPPVGIVSDALVLMNFSDINIFIVREDYSKKEYLHALNELVQSQKVHNLCILLNDSTFNKSYGYGYGYGYNMNGYGYHEEDKKGAGIFSVLSKKDS